MRPWIELYHSVEEKGTNVWFELDVEDLLPDSITNKNDYVKGTDTMDVWFDSGTSWAGVVGQRSELGKSDDQPADLYLEGFRSASRMVPVFPTYQCSVQK